MMTAFERRLALIEVLTQRRFDTIDNLASEFNVSRSTIKRDLIYINELCPHRTIQGNGGGVRVLDKKYSSHSYLYPEQEEFLNRLKSKLPAEDKKMMESILVRFAKPKI